MHDRGKFYAWVDKNRGLYTHSLAVKRGDAKKLIGNNTVVGRL